MKIFNIYCDESCHLENDHQQVMVLGAIWCPKDLSRTIARHIKAIKKKHGLSSAFEIKWSKVSPAKIDFYMDVLNYFFEEKELYFRSVIIPNKGKLCHVAFDHDHDTWYYKMYFELLKVLLNRKDRYRIYLDIKDSKSGEKVVKLHNILCNSNYDFERQFIQRIQNVRSHEIEQVQLADLLIGCVLAANKNDEKISTAKKALMERMCHLSKHPLTKTIFLRERKVNLLRWQASEAKDG